MGMKEDLARKRAERANAAQPATNGHISEDELREHGVIPTPIPDEIPAAEPTLPPSRPTSQTPWIKSHYLPEVHRQLPQSLDAEKGALSSIMNAAIRGPEYAKKAMFFAEQQIGANHFHLPAHKEIWKAMQALHRDNEPLDFITITEQLTKANPIAACGGASYVTEIGTFVPTHANLDTYLDILKEKHALRQIADLGIRLSAGAYDNVDPAFIIDEAANTLKAIKTAKRIGELPELDDMTNLMGENMPTPPAELVKGVLHRGSKMIIGGTSKGRKTFSLIDLAISVATGTEWWGLPTIKGKVCYINFEIQRPFFARRFADICRKKGTMPDAGQFKCWTLRGFSEGLEKMSANLIKILLQEDYVLIVFDPIYKALGDRDENKAGDVASMLNELEAIAVKTGAAIAFGAHYSKGNQAGKDAMDRIGGSGVFARDPDAILTMTPHAVEECFTVETTLRNFPPQKPFVVKWEWPLFERDDTEDPEDLKKPKNTRSRSENNGQFERKYSIDDIIDCLKETTNGRSPSELQKLVESETGMKRSKFYMLIKDAVKSPYVVRQNGRYYHIESLTKE